MAPHTDDRRHGEFLIKLYMCLKFLFVPVFTLMFCVQFKKHLDSKNNWF